MAKLPTFTGTGYRSEERFPGSLTRKLARSLAYVTGDETQALAAAMKGSGGTIDPSGFRREFQAHLATLAAHPGVPAKEPPNDGRDLDGKTRAALIEIG